MLLPRLAALGLIVVCCATAPAQFLPSELRSVWPSAAQSGTVSDVAVTGDRLDEVDRLLFSHPGITASVVMGDALPFSDQPRPGYGSFKVQVASDVPAGIYDVRTIGRHGVSNPRAFVVGNFPVQKIDSVSHDVAAPTALPLSHLIVARSTPASIDYYQLNIADKQQITVSLLAQSIDSRTIGYLKLMDRRGRVVASQRGADGFDPVLKITDQPAGTYTLAVHDFLYRGGEEFSYQLVALDGSSTTTPWTDTALGAGEMPQPRAPEAATTNAQLAADDATQTAITPQPLTLPHEGTWWFAPDHEACVFQFTGEQGKTIAIDIISQRLGEPTDARFLLRRLETAEDGSVKYHDVVTVDDSQGVTDGIVNLFSGDPVGLVTLPVTATYELIVWDLDVGESLSAQQKFVLRITDPQPRFSIVAYRDFLNRDNNAARPFGSKISRGGAESIRVFVVRHDGWAGAVELTAQELPTGLSCEPVTIAANQNQAHMTLFAADDAASGVGAIKIIGTGADGQTAEAEAVVLSVARGAGRDFLRQRRTSSLTMAVSANDVSPLTITFGEKQIIEVKKGQSVQVPITLTRREGSNQPVVLRPRDFPGGVSAGEITIAGDQTTGAIEVKTDGNAAVGTYSLWLQSVTKVKVRPNPQMLELAQAYRAHLQTLHDDPANADKLEAIKAAITAADQAVEAAKGPAGEQELTVFIPSSVATLKIVDP